MRVVVDANPLFPLQPGLGPTGVGRWTAGAVASLATAAPDWQIDLVAFHLTQAEIDTAWMGSNVSFRLVRFSNRVHRRLMVANLVPPLERFLGPVDAMLGPAFVTWPGRRLAQFPVIHDLSFVKHPSFVSRRNLWYLRAIVPRVIRRSARVLTVSETMRDEIADRFRISPDRIVIAPNGCDFERFSPEARTGIDLPEDYILFVGTLEPRKNLSGLLDAYRMLSERLEDVPPLVVTGGVGWRSEELERDLARAGGRVITLGYVPDEELPGLYAGARVLAFPSFYEGFGLPVLEAMACKTAVITSRRGGIPEVAGDCAVYVDPDDPASIAGGLERVLSDDALRGRLEEGGFRRSRGFGWDRCGDALRAAIEAGVATRKS